ncbi:MAG: substrate-binding domain-containing protein [Bacteroidia bacterium]
MNNLKYLFLAIIPAIAGCGASDALQEESTTRGSIRIATDDSYTRLIDTEVATFESLYKYATISVTEAPEGEVMDLLLNDSVRAVVVSRDFTEQEKSMLESKKVIAKSTKICTDGLAFVVNKQAPDSNFSFNELKDIFTGNRTSWNGLCETCPEKPIVVVFDHPKSGNARYIRQTFNIDTFPAVCSAVKSNQEVIEYVESHPEAIGIIGSNWISDPDDSVSGDFISRVRLAGVSSENDPEAVLGYHQPYQGYLADNSYPFRREVFILNRELGTRLATGFSSFVAGDKGQRIILKAGLVPAYGVIRLVETN